MKHFLKRAMLYFWNFWPPFLGAGIYIQYMSPDMKELRVVLKKRLWTANFIGTQFGGSIFAMVDPFYMVMLAINLGPEYFVVDQSSEVKFLKMGKTKLLANFKITDQDMSDIKDKLKTSERVDWVRLVEVLDLNNNVVATVSKNILIKKRKNV